MSAQLTLSPSHRLLGELIGVAARGKAVEQRFSDFDGVEYLMYNEKRSRNLLRLGMRVYCWSELDRYGARTSLSKIYGNMFDAETLDGYHVSLTIDTDNLKIGLLKRHAMATPFERAITEHRKLAAAAPPPVFGVSEVSTAVGELLVLHYREKETIYVQAGSDRVTVIFETRFEEETDQVLGRLFLQEFVDARRQVQTAPQVRYTAQPPLEIQHLARPEDQKGFVTFVLFPRHFQTVEMQDNTITQIGLFRDYLHYHIKCSKAYMHSRMRHRVSEFLKVLNRAKPDRVAEERKTASGRTFKQK